MKANMWLWANLTISPFAPASPGVPWGKQQTDELQDYMKQVCVKAHSRGDESYWVSFLSGEARRSRTSTLSLWKKHKSLAFFQPFPNICPSKEHLSLSLCSGFTFGPGSPDGPEGPDLPGRPGSPWRQDTSTANTDNQAELTTVRIIDGFRQDLVYLISLSSTKTTFTDVSGVTIRTLQSIKRTLGIGHNTTQYGCTTFLKIVLNDVLCRLGLLCSQERRSVRFYPWWKKMMGEKNVLQKNHGNVINRIRFYSAWHFSPKLYDETWFSKCSTYLLSICPVASWDASHALMTKRGGD